MPRIFIDVTLPISEALPVWPGDQPVEIVRPRDEAAAIERLSLSCHTGTHVDYPLHALEGGKCSSDYHRFPLTFLALVVDVLV